MGLFIGHEKLGFIGEFFASTLSDHFVAVE
jgi:hypothetical protein